MDNVIEMVHYDDGKGKWQSHEIRIRDARQFTWPDVDPFNIIGYGETKEEALRDFAEKFVQCLDVFLAYKTLLLEAGNEINMTEVDCCGNAI